jgi:outer membrane protein
MRISAWLLLGGIAPLWGQSSLSLTDAVQLGLKQHPAVQASSSARKAADARIEQARSGFLPKLTYSEAYQRSDNPVFVFSSLLTQNQFTAQNFDLGPLNRPNALNNFQSLVTADQTVYDFGRTRAQVKSAQLNGQIAGEDQRRAEMNVIAGVAGAYFGAILAKQQLAVAEEAVRSAEADLTRAQNVRSAGLSTDADVLSIRVHLADMREREIEARQTLDVAGAALDDALGLPLDTPHDLTTPLTPAKLAGTNLESMAKTSIGERPDTREAALALRVAGQQSSAAHSALFPRVAVHGAFEADRQTFATRGGSNWLFSASLEWNFFDGFANRARQKEAADLEQAAQAEQRRANSSAQLEVRRAYARFQGAQERIGVAAAAVSEAEESLRIVRNRYEAGLTTVTELLRNETAQLETQTNQLEAVYQQRLAAAALELASGTLRGDSDALK